MQPQHELVRFTSNLLQIDDTEQTDAWCIQYVLQLNEATLISSTAWQLSTHTRHEQKAGTASRLLTTSSTCCHGHRWTVKYSRAWCRWPMPKKRGVMQMMAGRLRPCIQCTMASPAGSP